MRPDLRRAVSGALGRIRPDAGPYADVVAGSGLLDQPWVEIQLDRRFATYDEALQACLADPDCSPHPLFVAEWIDAKLGGPTSGEHPLVWYLRDERVHRRASTHPLLDVSRIRELDPASADAPLGPVAAWLAQAGPDSPLPSTPGHPTTTLGELLDNSRQALRDALANRPGEEPPDPGAVSIVMVVRDHATVLRRTVESLQAQPQDWELLVVDAGSTDDSLAVLTGLARFDPRIRIVASEPHRGAGGVAVARNAALAEAQKPQVGLLEPGESWPPAAVCPTEEVRAAGGFDAGTGWQAAVESGRLVDWEAESERGREAGLTSVVLPARSSLRATLRWVNQVADWPAVELVVVGGGLPVWQEVALGVVARAAGNAHLVSHSANHGPAVSLNVGAAASSGELVVLVLGQVEPDEAALRALVGGFDGPKPAIAQSVDVDRRGVVVSAGAVFGTSTARPEPFLHGHSMDDVRRFGTRPVPAALGSVVAVRAEVLSRLGGLDPRAGRLAATGLALRSHERGLGRTVLCSESVVVTGSPALPPDAELLNDLDAIEAAHPIPPPGSEEAWAAAGFEVVRRELELVGDREPGPLDTPTLRPRSVLRPVTESVSDGRPSLRWTLDLAAPAGPKGRAWGDTHFGLGLANALRRLGQHVCVDPREARHRATRSLEDVVLVLRGLDRVAPRPECLNVVWVISHPDLVTAAELAGCDLVYAASTAWAAEASVSWGAEVRPLLQATDPALFHPGRAEPDSGAEVLFVGNSRGVSRASVDAALAMGAPVEVHGRGWAGLLPDEVVASPGIDNADLGAAYAAAGVVLNDHWDDMRRRGFVSNRLMDAAASGARVVSDAVPGVDLTGMFHGLVQTFEDHADLARILATRDELFPPPDERAHAAQKVAGEHSFDARAAVLLDDVLSLLD